MEEVFTIPGIFEPECGGRLVSPTISYRTWGSRNLDGSNVIWVCHALTANADVMSWWPGLFGENDLFNPKDYFIVCANVLGSCYGSTGPVTTNPDTGLPYYQTFPLITIRDMVKAHQALAGHLSIERINLVIGGSLGGQQALEWNASEPWRFQRMVVLATNAIHSPWGVAFNESQRLAIEADQSWLSPNGNAGMSGLLAARSIALLSYRTYEAYAKTQSPNDESKDPWSNQPAASYQKYQGEKLAKRFNAWSYWYLSKAMDSHNLGRNRGKTDQVLKKITAKTLVVGIDSDLLFPLNEQNHLANVIPEATLKIINSDFGHDGFLVEVKKLASIIGNFMSNSDQLVNIRQDSESN